LPGHTDAVVAITTAKTDDGQTVVVSGGRDGHVRITSLDDHLNQDDDGPAHRAEPGSVDADLGDEVVSLAIATFPDGEPCAVVGGSSGTVCLLDLRDGTLRNQPWSACSGAVTAVAAGRVHRERATVFTAGPDSTVQAWDASTGEPAGEGLALPGPALAMAYDTESSSLMVGGMGVAVIHPRLGG
jgi:WD40 repeat protein